jgi:hypothetical protein
MQGTPLMDQIDKFRQEFFDKLAAEQLEQQRQLARKQKNCFHTFKAVSPFIKQCTKCDYTR